MDNYDSYQTPLNTRYAGENMRYLFSAEKKIRTWRRLWITLAECERELGLPITEEQLAELRAHADDINFAEAEEREKLVRHDVMAHVYAYGLQCPKAKPIIHLGATSCYVGDNADLIIMAEGLDIIRKKLASVIAALASFAREYKDMPTLGFTHFQPAQLVTVGKRACLWIQDMLFDLEECERLRENTRLLGSKGTTGTQASFMELFDNDYAKVKRLDRMIAEKLDFPGVYAVSGQTYTRKTDSSVMGALSQIAQSAAKFSNDMRLLQHMKEVEEPYEKNQIGSSAMAYKRNPMRSERVAGLARYVIANAQNTALTASAQWLERSLDDSSNKRIALPEAFLAVDAILNICLNVASGLVVYPRIIDRNIRRELPFMITENILMKCVKNGGDRQELHERVRLHSVEASTRVKVEGLDNDLLSRIAGDPAFGMDMDELESMADPALYIGCAPMQVEDFLNGCVAPALEGYELAAGCELNV